MIAEPEGSTLLITKSATGHRWSQFQPPSGERGPG